MKRGIASVLGIVGIVVALITLLMVVVGAVIDAQHVLSHPAVIVGLVATMILGFAFFISLLFN